MTQEEIKFCEDNIINFESVKLGFSRHIEHYNLDEYTRIYQRNLDANFVLNAFCGACVFDMLKRLSAHYEGVLWAKKREEENQTTNQSNDKPVKNTRKRK